MIAFSYGRITRASVARNPVAKGVLLPLKLAGLGLFPFKLSLHFSKPLLLGTASKGYPNSERGPLVSAARECAIWRGFGRVQSLLRCSRAIAWHVLNDEE